MKKLLLFGLLMIAIGNLSCECGWDGNFLTVAPNETLIIKAKILQYYKNDPPPKDKDFDVDVKMEVEVLAVFKGKETRKKIMVWGDNGVLCRPYVSSFKKANIYYLALRKSGDTDYTISVCGEYYLKIDDGKVQMKPNAATDKQPKKMTTAEFEKALKAKLK